MNDKMREEFEAYCKQELIYPREIYYQIWWAGQQKSAGLLGAAERYLDFRHTADIGMGTEYSGLHPETELKKAIAKAKNQ